jgi:hypothetical protein
MAIYVKLFTTFMLMDIHELAMKFVHIEKFNGYSKM